LAISNSSIFDSKRLRIKAKETGLVERKRKIDPVIMFWTIAIGYGTQPFSTLSELKHEYEVRGNVLVSDSIWQDRFTPELAVSHNYAMILDL
jgi:putative transposase